MAIYAKVVLSPELEIGKCGLKCLQRDEYLHFLASIKNTAVTVVLVPFLF